MSVTENSREVVYVKAKFRNDEGCNQYKKFAIDPHITTYNILFGILCKCFNLDGDFSICYLTVDEYGEQFYLPLKSDWDLDASIFTLHDSTLRLRITLTSNNSIEPNWNIVLPNDIEIATTKCTNNESKQSKSQPVVSSSFLLQISQRWEKTFSSMRKAIGYNWKSDDDYVSPTCMSLQEFGQFTNDCGRLIHLDKFYRKVYLCGLEYNLRKDAWQILLSVCPPDTSGQERSDLLQIKAHQYQSLKQAWKQLYLSGRMSERQLNTLASISIDVVRTDWKQDYYRTNENSHRISQLFDLLATYCMNHPSIGYSQGMSDLASPLLIVQNDEALAYICFCALMQRVKTKFGRDQQFNLVQNMRQLFDLLVLTDTELADFFWVHNLADMYFTHRWFVLELKREFTFVQSLYLFEIQWALADLVNSRQLNRPDLETSNSKSGGYLVLTESSSSSSSIAAAGHGSEPDRTNDSTCCQWEKYTSRDVSLINSLIGSDYVVSLLTNKCCPNKLSGISRNSSNCSNKTSLSQSSSSFEVGQNAFEYDNDYHSVPVKQIDNSNNNNNYNEHWPMQLSCGGLKNYTPNIAPLHTIGFGNPFLIFLCLSLILEYKPAIIGNGIEEPGEIIQFFQERSGHHHVDRIVCRARKLFGRYLVQQNMSPI